MKIIIFLGITILSASWGVVASDFDPADAANREIMACQFKAATQFDDGISGVNALATIVADWCQKESDQFYRIMRSRVNGPIDERAIRQALRDKDLQMASRVILTKRANDRKDAQNSISEWTKVGGDAITIKFMNFKTAQKTNNGISIWSRFELKEAKRLPSGKEFLLLEELTEYDCQNGRYRWLAANFYADVAGKFPLSLDSNQGDWKRVNTDSVSEEDIKFACSRR
jgi:hypothetical protein